MSKQFKKDLDIYFNEVKDISNRPTKRYNYLIFDEEKHNNFITNSYSIIRLNNNNKKEKENIEIVKEYGFNKDEYIVNSIIKMHNTQIDNHYCIPHGLLSEIKEEQIKIDDNKKFLEFNGILFDLRKIKHIAKLIGGDCGILTSETEHNFICLSGKSGYAYLLGCRTY